MDELIKQATEIASTCKFRECEVGCSTWTRLTSGQQNIRSLHFNGLTITPSHHVPEGRIWPKEGRDK